MKKPICLLDVDGVIAPWPGKFGFDQDVYWHHEGARVHLRRDLPQLIRRLHTVTELQWGTAWEREANVHLIEHMGLFSPLPYIEFKNYDDLGEHKPVEEIIDGEIFHRIGTETWKLAWIERFACQNPGRPFAWIDDEIHADALEYAEIREAPTLFICTDGLVGLDESTVEQVETWVSTEVYEWENQNVPD